jgi:photosystem II stability/assembly factor-like uncharacterized protein
MKKKCHSRAGFFNLRNLSGLIVALGGVFLTLVVFGTLAKSQSGAQSTQKENDAIHEDPAARAAWERLRLQDEQGRIPPDALRRAYEQNKAMPFRPEAWAELLPKRPGISPEQAEQIMWTSIGPGNIGGRIRSIVSHPTADVIWLGAVGGGIWKTTNGGTSWSTTTDYLANIAVNCMIIDPRNADILYAGTGEGFFSIDAIQGDGIFKTTDAGVTWAQLSSTAQNPDFYWVNRLAISPSVNGLSSQVLLAATRTGVFRSTDGGTTWSLRLAGVFDDVLFQPSDDNKCVASTHYAPGKAYYSTNAGLTWTQATFPWPTSAGRIELAYSRSNPLIVYANVEYNGGQLYRSTDGGHSYSTILGTGSGGTGASWYSNVVWVDPTNSNTLVFGGGNIYRSTDGGSTSLLIQNGMHADNHVIVNDPNYNGTTNKIAYAGNDGGMYKTTNIISPTWTSLNHTLGITQFYAGCGTASSGKIIGGTQDNGIDLYTGNPESWIEPLGGDGGFCACDQTNANYLYGELINLQIYRSSDAGSNWYPIWNGPNGIPGSCNAVPCANFIAPFILDPNNANRILAGGDNLWRSNDVRADPPSWSSIKGPIGSNISAIAIAPGNSDVVWVGYNNGLIYYTLNGTATNPIWTQANTGLPVRYCTRLAISQLPPGGFSRTIYATFGGFSADNVWKTTNNGLTWTSISPLGRLPQIPVNSLVISPSNSNQLYIGTQIAVFATSDGGNTWSPTNEGPVNTVIDELFWQGTTLGAATHGRSMFTATIQ